MSQSTGTSHAGYPNGHFYSPVVSIEEATARQADIWTDTLTSGGIDYAPDVQKNFIERDLSRYIDLYTYPEKSALEGVFYDKNPAFSWLDSRALFTMLLKHKPRKMIEVGSGFSSLLTADVNVRFLNGTLDFTCIEPFPKDFLLRGVPGISRLIQAPVQSIDIKTFRALDAGDILFIDSSHVSKVGSDVNFLIFEVLPSLKRGVIIHFHDIFLPREYPPHWILQHHLSWNEQYIIRALLMGTRAFEVLFGCAYALYAFPDVLQRVLESEPYGGGSLWIVKSGDL